MMPTITPVKQQESAPLPQEEDIIRTFINLINEDKPSEAVMMMAKSITDDDSQKQAWAVQFNNISLIKIISINPSSPENWTDSQHSYELKLDLKMNPDSSMAPIPYYGWNNGENIRWINLVKEDNLWKIKSIATGP
jgi:hypothetical protein